MVKYVFYGVHFMYIRKKRIIKKEKYVMWWAILFFFWCNLIVKEIIHGETYYNRMRCEYLSTYARGMVGRCNFRKWFSQQRKPGVWLYNFQLHYTVATHSSMRFWCTLFAVVLIICCLWSQNLRFINNVTYIASAKVIK